MFELGILFKMGRVVWAIVLEDCNTEPHSSSFTQVCTLGERGKIWGLKSDFFEFSFETNIFWSHHSGESRISIKENF
jgi:hypothetical protein